MKAWMRLGMGIAALVLAVIVGTGAYATYGVDDAQPRDAAVADAMPGAGHDAAGSGGDGTELASSCLVGTVDCNDAPGIAYGDVGDESAKCAAGAVACIEPAACPSEGCPAPADESCTTIIDPDGATVVTCIGCGYAEPVPVPFVEPAQPVEPAIDLPAPEVEPPVGEPTGEPAIDPLLPAPDSDPGMAGTGCLGEDPCPVSSRPLCVSGDCAVSSDGAAACPPIAPCAIAETPPGEMEVKPLPAGAPCLIGPCFRNDPFAGVPESCPTGPCMNYAPDEPQGALCDPISPCEFTVPEGAAREGGAQTCPHAPGGGRMDPGSGTGSGSSSGGSTDPGLPAE